MQQGYTELVHASLDGTEDDVPLDKRSRTSKPAPVIRRTKTAATYERSMFQGAYSHQVLVTEFGSLGFGPRCARPGDIVFVFDGADTPTLVREFEGIEGPIFVIIGEAYIQGYMDGEAVAGNIPSEEMVIS